LAYPDLLKHKATIRRRATGTDRFAQKTNVYQTFATNVPCRVTRAGGGERNNDKTTHTVHERTTMFVLAGQDIREDDRVTVHASDGVTVLADEAEVTHVRIVTDRYGSEHHREIELEVIRSAT
jgi:hypothetical protein